MILRDRFRVWFATFFWAVLLFWFVGSVWFFALPVLGLAVFAWKQVKA